MGTDKYSCREKLEALYKELYNGKKERRDIHRGKDTNAGLWLDKYIKNQDDADSRSGLVREVSEIALPAAYKLFYQRWEQTLTNYGVPDKYRRLAEAKGRLIVGLGDESVLETSIALHHTYGVPYIPGSALKGLAASYARQRLGEKWSKGSEAYKVIFGDTNEAGYVTFFDALYKPDTGHNGHALYPDVITVHHPKYYQGEPNATPSDWDSPTPIPFLSTTGEYLVALAAPDLKNGRLWVDQTFEILKLALKEMGIGAKTSSGYGRMTLNPIPPHPQMLKVENFRIAIARITNLAGEMPHYHQEWLRLTLEEARITLARIIVEKAEQSGNKKNLAQKPWYAEPLAYLKQIDG